MEEDEAIALAEGFLKEHQVEVRAVLAATYNGGTWTICFGLPQTAGVIQHPNEVFVSVDEQTEDMEIWQHPF